MTLKFFLLIIALVSAASAGPAGSRSSECASECDPKSKFFYEIGRKYEYSYEAQTLTTVGEAFSEKAVVKVTTLATIQPVTPCEYILSVSDVSLHDSAKSEAFAAAVTRKPLRFAIKNGRVEHICGPDDEATWVINFKKGILSNFQNSMNNLEEDEVLSETDVSGVCETSYSSRKEGSKIIVTRNKTPSKCAQKTQIHQKLSSFGYTFDSVIQGLPIMTSSQQCTQHISDEIIKGVQCEETHVFLPFSNRASGVKTNTMTSLKLVAVKTNSSPFLESFTTRTELLFDHPELENEEPALEASETLLAKLKVLTENGVKKEVPGLFSELVMSLRGLSHPQIQILYNRSGAKVKNFIIDALPLVGTAASMGAFVDLIIKGEIPEKERDVWFTSLAFIKNPSLEMFPAIQPLLEGLTEEKALLGISSLVHNYCLKDAECELRPNIKNLLRKIESHLGISCRATSEEDKINILYALKALGNVGRFVNAESILKRCYLEDNPMEIRIAAIDAWRRIPCNYNRNHLLTTYSDQTQDNEIRIASYLGLMKCPTQELVDTLKDRLTSESVNQVESFVWTHLANLQETAAPEKQWIRHLIGEELLQKKFSPNALKLSRNYESSFFFKESDFGASMESNMIFSSKSFLPRSTMLNLTIDLFGESINLFEVGGRIEGFESYIEKFFGPDGYFPEETIAAIIQNMRKDKSSEESEATNLESLLAKDTDDPKGSYYFKILGNELFYRNFEGIENIFPERTFSTVFDLLIELLSKGSIDYVKNYNLINSEFTFPTITGFPLKLNVNGTATVGLKLDGQFNFEDFSSIDIQGKLRPSAAVRMDASMSVDAFVTKSGIKMISTLHSSTAVEGKAIINKGKLVDLTVNVPQEKVEIFDMTNEYFRIDYGDETKLALAEYDYKDCFPILHKTLGMEACYEMSCRGAPLFRTRTFFDPYKTKIFLHKTDSHSAFVFHYSNNPDKTAIVIDMPGSQTDKRWSASMTRENQKYEIDVHSPIGSASGMLSYVIGNKEINVESEVSINDIKTFKAKFNIVRNLDDKHKQIKSEIFLESSAVQGEVFKFNGEVDYDEETKSINAEVVLRGSSVPSFTANFNVNRKSNENSLDFNLVSTPFEMSLSGVLGKLTSEGLIALKGKYRLFNNPPKSLTTTIKYQKQEEGEIMSYSASIEIVELDFNTDLFLELNSIGFDSTITGKFSHITWDVKNSFSFLETGKMKELKYKHYSHIPYIDWEMLVDSHSILSDEQFLVEKKIKYSHFSEDLKLLWNYDKNFLFNAEITTPQFSHSQAIKLEINKLSEGSYTLQVYQDIYQVKIRLEGSLEKQIADGSFYTKVKGLYNYDCGSLSTGAYDFMWTIKADESEMKSETNLNCDGNNCFLIVHATNSSLTINSNISKPFTAEAKVVNENEVKSFLITSNLDNTVFEASGSISPQSLQGTLKYKEQEIKLLGRLHDQGVELEAQLSPLQKFSFFVNYKFGREMSLDLGLETPFEGWQKQDASFTLKLGDSIQGQASITWKNIHHITLNVDLTNEFINSKESYFGSCRFSSTIKNFEKFEISLKHSMSQNMFRINFEGKWNSEIMKGNFDIYPTENGFKLDMTFKSPFTEDFSASFNHKMTQNDIAELLDIAYGSQKSRILLKGNIIDYKNMNGSFICFSPFLPEVTINATMQTSSTSKTIEVKGKYDGKKILLLANCETFMTNQENTCKLALKLVTSSSKIFSASFSNKVNFENEFATDIDVSSVFLSDQSIKGHIEGKLSSLTSAVMTGYISGPNISGRMNMNHEIINKKLQTVLNFEMNSLRASVILGGNINLKTKEGSLHGEIESTLPLLDGCKMMLQHSIQDETRETYVTFSKKDYNLKLYHTINIKDFLNWSNFLKINDVYSIRNEMISSLGYLKHNSNINWLEKNISFTFEANYGDTLNITSMLDSPWTSLIHLTINHEKEGEKRKTEMKLEYGNGKNLLLESEYEFKKNSKFITLSIFNRDWSLTPLSIETKMKNTINKKLDFTLRLNQMLIVVLQLFKKDDTYGGNMTIKFNRNNKPVSFMGKYLSTLNEKETYIEFEAEEKYTINLKFNGDETSGKLSSVAIVPLFFRQPLRSTISYNFKDKPLHIVINNILEEKRYRFETLVADNEFILKSITPSGEGSLNFKWELNEIKKKFALDFKSPFKFVKDAAFSLMYDSQHDKIIDFQFIYDIHKINFEGKLNDHSLEFESNTTLSGWEKIRTKIEFSDSDLEGMFSKNSQIVTFSGKGNFECSKGEGEFHFTLPVSGYESNSAYIKYSIGKNNVDVHLKTEIGSKALNFQVLSTDVINTSKKMMLDIESPWDNMEKVLIQATIEESSVKMNGKFNEFNFDSLLEINSRGDKNGNIMFLMTSNIPDWTSFSAKVNFNLSQTPYIMSLVIKQGEHTQNYFLSFDINKNNFDLEIKTPITSLQYIKVNGNYKYEHEKFDVSLLFTNNYDNFNLSGHINFSFHSPAIKITVVTPYSGKEEIEFNINGKLFKEKSVYFLLRTGEHSYKVDIYTRLYLTNGSSSVSIAFPVSGLRDIKFNLSYDLEGEKKYMMIDMEHEGILERFSFEGKLVDNEFTFGIESPVEHFKRFLINAQYQKHGNEYVALGLVITDNGTYQFEGKAIEKDDGYEIRAVFPITNYESVSLNGTVTRQSINLKLKKGNDEKEILITYELTSEHGFIKMHTPFDQLSYLAVGCEFERIESKVNANIFFHKNSERLEISGFAEISPKKLNVKSNLAASFLNGGYSLQIFYDIISEKKEVGLVLENGGTIQKYLIETLFDGTKHGYIKIYTPFSRYELSGIEYKFEIIDITDAEAFFTLIKNSEETTIGIQSKFNKNELLLQFKTPFTDYATFGIESRISSDNKEGKARINIGKYVLHLEAIIRPENFSIYIETPFDGLHLFKISSKYGLKTAKKFILMEFIYNDTKYEVGGNAVFSQINPEISFKLISPLEFMNKIEIIGKFDLASPSELLEIGLMVNSIKYYLSLGYQIEDLKASLKLHFVSPLTGWKNFKLNASIDLESDTKVLDISFERDHFSRLIFLSGKLTDGELDFDIQTPFETIGNFRTRGSLNRSKRSIEFEMMNDSHSGGIVASFNSFKITAKTPFEKAKDISFELSKERKGGWTLDYKRNNNEVYLNISLEPKKKGLSVTIKSEIPGWELLALAGRLDTEKVIGYIKGQINSDMVHISGNGMLAEKTSSLEITATTSFEKYREVITKIEYNSRRKIFTFKSHSTSSDYKIMIEFKRALVIDIFIPNEQENTIVKGKLAIFKGDLTISSRFPKIRTFSLSYTILVDPDKTTVNSTIERNGVKIFELEFERKRNTSHFMVHVRRGENHSMLHIHKEQWKKYELTFHRNGKEFKVDITGSGALPASGTFEFSIFNSFREIPRTVTGKLDVNRTSSPKILTLTVTWHTGKVYQFILSYNATLRNINRGNFTLRTITQDKSMDPWKDISGRWNFDRNNQGKAFLKIGQREYTATGKIGIFQSDLEVESNIRGQKYYLQWKFIRNRNFRDYFLKIGPEDRYIMLKFNGSLDNIYNGNISGAFRISPIMVDDFIFTAQWSRNAEGLTGNGKFSIGKYSGTHTIVKFKRNPIERSAIFHWEAISDIKNFNKVTLRGEYNLARRMIDIKLTWDTDELFLKGSLDNMTKLTSQNTILYNIPRFGGGEITLSHDFSNPLAKSIKAIGNMGQKKVSYIASWTRNEPLTMFDLKVDAQSGIFGSVHLQADFDIRDLNNAKGNLEYKRNNDKSVTLKWSRIKTQTNLVDEMLFNSHFHFLPSARLYLNADWSTGFQLDGGIEWKDKAIEINLKIESKETTAFVKTPFENFENITVKMEYDLKKPKSKTLHFEYSRGDREIILDFKLKIVTKKTGTLSLTLSSPFDILKSLTLHANWKKGKFTAEYKRNDITVNLEGNAEVKSGKSSFDIRFTPPGRDPIAIKFSYDLESFVKGTGKTPKNLINFKLDINKETIEFDVQGYRNQEKIYIEISGSTSLDFLSQFYMKLDSELNLNSREGLLELRVNDFHYNMKNSYEKRPNGFYARSQIESSLTTLPGLTIGFGRDGDSFIATVGYGDEREITITFKGKDHFKKGFSGTIDIPRRGVHNLEYSVTYIFKSDDKLVIDIKIKLEEEKYIEIEIVYSSDGVKSRLSTPWTGTHRARMRRSITDDYFMADIGVDNYGFILEGKYDKNSFKKGFKIEGQLFGERLLINGFLNLNTVADSEGKLIIKTTVQNYENLGGFFKVKLTEQRFYGEIDVHLLHHISAKVDIDLVNKIRGDAVVTLENLVYEIECDFIASETDVMKGNLIIRTPHPSLERIAIEGTINAMSFKHFEASFAIDHPSYPYNFDILLKLDAPVYSLDLTLNSPNNKNYRIIADYSLIRYPFYLKGNSSVYLNKQNVFDSNLEISYKGMDDTRTICEVNYGKDYFKGSANIQIKKDQINGELMGAIMNNHTLEIKVNLPTHLNQLLIEATYEGKQRHSLLFKMTKETTFRKVILDVKSLFMVRGSLELTIYKTRTTMKTMVETSRGKTKFNMYFETALQTDGSVQKKFVNEIEIDLPYFVNKCNTYIELLKTSTAGEITIRFRCGEIVHFLYGKFVMLHNLYKLHINVETPFLQDRKGNIIISCNVNKQLKISIESIIWNYINNIYIDVNRNYGLIINCVSPFIPTGMAKVEGNLLLDSLKDIQFKLMFADANKTLSAEGKVKWDIENETKVFLEIRTPYDEYEKMEFGLNYVRSDLTRIAMFAKPFNLEAESYFGNEASVFRSGIELKTGIEYFELTKAEAIIPLNKFEPTFSAYFGGIEYKIKAKIENTDFGGALSFEALNMFPTSFEVSYRSKAPFELNLELAKHSSQPMKFGVMFDSSFLVFKDIAETWVMM